MTNYSELLEANVNLLLIGFFICF